MLHTGARFYSKFSGCPHGSAVSLKFWDAPQWSAIFFKIFRMLCTGAQFLSKFSGCSARERDFLQNLNEDLNEEDELERSTPSIEPVWLHRHNRSVVERRRRETYTEAIPEHSAQDRLFERRKLPRVKYTGTCSV